MAKKAYIGVDGVARKVKKGYLGVDVDVPIYSEETKTVAITADNIAEYFEVTNGSYYFVGSGSIFTTNNGGVKNSTASTVLKARQDISALSFSYSYSSEANYDKFTLVVAGTTVESAVSGSTTSKTYSGSLTVGQTIEFTYVKDNSNDANDDQCTFSAMSITATVKTQTGVETKAVARKIKKAYIGIGGVARPCWSGGELTYYGTATNITGRVFLGATTIGDYALFGGGASNSGWAYAADEVSVYNKSLVYSKANDLTVGGNGTVGVTVGDYALFGGQSTTSAKKSPVDAYNSSLTHFTPTSLSVSRKSLAGSAVGNYALFAGGYSGSVTYADVDAYDGSLTQSIASSLSGQRYELAGGKLKNYALFGGGQKISGGTSINYYIFSTVYAYDSSLTRTIIDNFSQVKRSLACASGDNRVIFAGGYATASGETSETVTATVDVYDSYLVHSVASELSGSRALLAATTIGDYALFGGGDDNVRPTYGSNIVDVYDSSLVHSQTTNLSTSRQGLAATTVGDFALFGGGGYFYSSEKKVSGAVDVYTIL